MIFLPLWMSLVKAYQPYVMHEHDARAKQAFKSVGCHNKSKCYMGMYNGACHIRGCRWNRMLRSLRPVDQPYLSTFATSTGWGIVDTELNWKCKSLREILPRFFVLQKIVLQQKIFETHRSDPNPRTKNVCSQNKTTLGPISKTKA